MKSPVRVLSMLVAMSVACVLAADGEDPLRFVRVHVPHGSLSAIDLGEDRYVPMSASEFEAAISRQVRPTAENDPFRGATPLLDLVRYEARLGSFDGPSTLLGTASWTVGAAMSAVPSLPLGKLPVHDAQMTTAAGTGDAIVFGRADGSLAMSTPEPGHFVCQWRCQVARTAQETLLINLPLVPALASTIRLKLPRGLVPIVPGAVVRPVPDTEPESTLERTWRIDVGFRSALEIAVASSATRELWTGPRLLSWTAAAIVGRQIRMRMLVEPDAAWQPAGAADETQAAARVTLMKDATTLITSVRLHEPPPLVPQPQWREADEGRSIEIQVPTACFGSQQPLLIEAVAPLPGREAAPATLPLLLVTDDAWAGGGIVIETDPTQVIADLSVERAVVVAPATAAAWKIPEIDRPSGSEVKPSRISLEQQGPRPRVDLEVRRRLADLNVQRVTVVDVSPEAVLARTTCDLTVRQGEAFELQGLLTKGWFIDTVELVSAAVRPPLAAPQADSVEEPPEWKVVRRGDRNELRVGFTTAVTPAKPVMLRITGHRAGMVPGVPFSSADLDMVTLRGETPDAVLAVRTGAEMTIDLEQSPGAPAIENPRLAPIVEDSGVRVRLPSSHRSQQKLRLVRRRPPLDVNTDVRLTARDGRLIEAYTFACVPGQNEIDSIIVHFSAVMDDRLEWQLLPPATGTAVARRIDAAERRDSSRGEPIVDTWVVELTPPASQPVTIRAACTIGFPGRVPIPLAWVEGAVEDYGTLTIREAGRFRPRVVNHRLSELPPRNEVSEQAYATVAEFSYVSHAEDGSDLVPAAELVPGGGSKGEDARAWAWRERTTVWCHAHGATEYETQFDLENHGRSNVAFTLPAGLQLQGAIIDGQPVPSVARGTGGGDIAIELPSGRRSLTLAVRAMARYSADRDWWQVDIQGGSLDVPVLQRDVRVMLAPDVDIVWRPSTHHFVEGGAALHRSWLQRLLGASWRWSSRQRPAAGPAAEPIVDGIPRETGGDAYREYQLMPVVGRRDGGRVTLVDARFISSLAILAASVSCAVVLAAPIASGWFVAGFALLCAIGSFWLPSPFDDVSRAAWWGSLVAGGVRFGGLVWWLPKGGGVVVVLCLAGFSMPMSPLFAVEPADEPLRVFFTPVTPSGDGEAMALVPEPLFRHLARDESQPAESRILSWTLSDEAVSTADGPVVWRMVIDVDTDAGTTLLLDQKSVGGHVHGALLDGRQLPDTEDGAVVKIPFSEPGRHRIECRIVPSVERVGQVELTTIVVPVAPNATLLLSDALAAVADCEYGPAGGPFLPPPTVEGESRAVGRFDVSRAAVIRVAKPVDIRLRLSNIVRAAESRNDLVWGIDACRLSATFSWNRTTEIVRSFIVRVDPGTVCHPADISWELESGDPAAVRVLPLGGNRFFVERAMPLAGEFSTRLAFRLPLSNPVGVFAIPGAWIEAAAVDSRLTQLVPAADLSIDVRLPPHATTAQRDTESSLQAIAWRTETVGSTAAAVIETVPEGYRGGTLTVRRRQPSIRATQRLALDFSAASVGMQLQARIDAGDTPLAEARIRVPIDAVVDRVELYADQFSGVDTEIPRPLDMCWSRVKANEIRVVVQQPQTGRFRLEAAARVDGRASDRGTVAVMRAEIEDSVPLAVAWTCRDGRGVAAVPIFSEAIGEEGSGIVLGDHAISGVTELLGGEIAILYERSDVRARRAAPDVTEPTTIEPSFVAGQSRERVELADIAIVLDQRGRCWGSVRFDVVTEQHRVKLLLPRGMRLFETLVDGRPANASPCDDGTWEIPLLTTRWPRSVLAVFAGDMGASAGDGKPFNIEAPVIEGLPCMRIAWQVHTPGGDVLRVADPARIVTEAMYRSERAEAFGRLEADFARAIESASPPERRRLEEFVGLRRNGEPLTAERPWMTQPVTGMVSGDTLYAIVDAPMNEAARGGLAVRIGRRIDPTARGRVLATLVLVLAAIAVGKIVQLRPRSLVSTSRWLVPAVASVAGLAWLGLLTPSWPGWLMVAAGAVDGLPRAFPWRRMSPADESTIAQFASPAGMVIADVPSTQQMPLPPR